MVQHPYQEKQKGMDGSGFLDRNVGSGGLALKEMENKTPTCDFLGSESIMKSCDGGSYKEIQVGMIPAESFPDFLVDVADMNEVFDDSTTAFGL